MKITFSQLPALQYITDKKQRFEAVYVGPDKPPEVYIAGTTQRAMLPERAMQALVERFDLVHMQDKHAREILILEIKPCTI